MKRQILAWSASGRWLFNQEASWQGLWILGLLGGAIALYTLDLGALPLRDWDEGTVAQVAREIYTAPVGSLRWLLPTLWGEPYLNHPPLLPNLIALAYHLGGVNEGTARLPGAILTACSVPLLYGVGREVFHRHKPALYSALIYLTWLPVVRQGRLAMVEGGGLCFGVMLFWCVLRSRRDLRWGLGIGISLGLLGLTKGTMAIGLGAIALIFLAWDTPRLLSSVYLWLGIALGTAPVVAWYIAQGFPLDHPLISSSVASPFAPQRAGVEPRFAPPWYYFLELLKYGFPWLLFVGYGLKLAKDQINWSWGKLVLIWGGGYFLFISLMMTNLPWDIVPIYPAIAIAGGAKLAEVEQFPVFRGYPKTWTIALILLTVATTFASFYFAITDPNDFTTVVILGAVILTLGMTAMLIEQRDAQFILILAWGSYVSLLLLTSSPHWNWELNQAYPVKPVARLMQQVSLPPQTPIYTSFPYERPSLNFYSQRRILPLPVSSEAYVAKLKDYWHHTTQPYLLIDRGTFAQLPLSSVQVVGRVKDWVLVTKAQAQQ